MREGGAEFQSQKVLTKAAGKMGAKSSYVLRTQGWHKSGRQHALEYSAKLMDIKRWGWECMLQLQ
jgi:hypothetical protein